MGNFDFVRAVFPNCADDCMKAESYIFSDPIAACAYARRAIDVLVEYLHYDVLGLDEPDRDNLDGRTNNPEFRQHVDSAIIKKLNIVRKIGNVALHDEDPNISVEQANAVARELFQIMLWTGYRFTVSPDKVPLDRQFDPNLAKRAMALNPQQRNKLIASIKNEREKHAQEIAERDNRIKSQDATILAQQAELERMREQIKAMQQTVKPDKHDYTYKEDETRTALIDLMLAEQGWDLRDARSREFKVENMPKTQKNPSGVGYVDYVLWGDDGLPLAVVEAKRTSISPSEGEQQAQAYADALEKLYHRRPVIFMTNGYKTRIWDDRGSGDEKSGGDEKSVGYPPRDVEGFYKKDELERLIARRKDARVLSAEPISLRIAGRPYQQAAIKAVDEAFDARQRAALLVMATGTGKTRVVVSLVEQLMKAGWVYRVLFLADRTALVNQAANAFKNKDHGLGKTVPVVNLLEDDKAASGRVYLSTYQTMMNLVNVRELGENGGDDGARGKSLRFGPGFFDLVIIDEAHRSVYAKYGVLFRYFDSLLVGLTATPKNEVDRNTYRLFGLEYDEHTGGVPTFAYDFEQAVKEGYLVPARVLPVNTKFMDRGITYDELSPEEQEEWDSKDWDETGDVPDKVDANDVNRVLFNEDTIDKILGTLMTHGIHVEGGDTLGKTIIFARNQAHAEAIKARFDAGWPQYGGTFARIITHATRDAQALIESFEDPEGEPHIAISVDMLDTGVDVPEVVNLVFFKPVMSRTKYWQMLGRGTRLCADLFGPGKDKTEFLIIDCCRNVAFFNEHFEESNGYTGRSARERLFLLRLGLLETLDRAAAEDPKLPERLASAAFGGSDDDLAHYRSGLVRILNGIVGGMDPDGNVLVRPHRLDIETLSNKDWWASVTNDKTVRAAGLAGLPTTFDDGEDTGTMSSRTRARWFDLRVYTYELALLRAKAEASEDAGGADSGDGGASGYGVEEPGISPDKACQDIRGVAEQLLDPQKRNIPGIAECAELLEAVAGEDWWTDVTVPMLETARKRIRTLVRYVNNTRRNIVFTDFEDELTIEAESGVTGGGDVAAVDMERFREKAGAFLRGLENDITLARVRMGSQLTELDLRRLERMLLDNGVGSEQDIEAAAELSGGFGLFIRSLVGLDRNAVETAFARFLDGKRYNARQIRFVNLIVRELTANGAMDGSRLYESPFIDMDANGPEGVFPDGRDIDVICDILDGVRRSAIPLLKTA
ncbi:restriction endonuclease subunit R [Bifidobacterium rousetti]|uniref:DEAD/DEAH box helicase family protein n=1 Tax=Bifidobacterium rousetti TaxID=2045439 RepID=UPI00123AB8DA|nr:DEAD/DEAH box helicase family protein [Bifidobacterium rousetti]KAA8818091.1 restriction endonuclease subunit R [Bifidobacterium rousetti]